MYRVGVLTLVYMCICKQQYGLEKFFSKYSLSSYAAPTCAAEAMLIDKCLSLNGTVPVHISGE